MPITKALSNSRRIRRTVFPVVLALLVTALPSTLSTPPITAAAAAVNPCTAPVANAIACENSLPGTPGSDWQVAGSGDATIQGFATSMSVNVGEPISFKIKSATANYHLDILRLGYYQGDGARKIASSIPLATTALQNQPNCLTDSSSGLVDCGNWAVSASWTVPATAVSGVYIAHMVRNDTGGDSLIPFVVRNDASHSDIVFQTSDETWQAYNTYGGNSLYQCTVACPPGNPLAYKAAFKVSYNRPFKNTGDMGHSWLMDTEYPMIRFLESNGFDVSYISGIDSSTRAPLLLNHKTFMSTGHDEYWSGQQRTNVEAARDAGVNLAFFSGNEVFWKTRLEPGTDASLTANRTLVSYKDTHFNTPTDPVAWTGSWRDPRFGTAGGGGNPENSLTGQFFLVNSGSTDIKVPAAYASLRLWRNTAAARLTGTQSLTLGSGLDTLGYEWDVDVDNGSRPAGAFDLSSTTFSAPEVFTDYGSATAPGTETHHLVMYRAASGALVFGAGTVQWAYGLDGYTTLQSPDKNMQQATVNLFADMGAQPATLISGLVAATKSTDTTPPTTKITSALNGQTFADGAKVTISGTAADIGGVVAGVEVSTDNGATWHPASGTDTWTYTWIAHGSPSATIKTRAVDDSGNLETPSAGSTATVSCPCSLWGTNVIPDVTDSGDGGSVEVGMKFSSDTAGTITGVRFYKSAANKGTHVGNLWTAGGSLLASATFTGETASGWQSVTFSQPVSITANTTYVVSYYAPQGHYAQAAGYMYAHPSPMPAGNSTVDSAPLHAARNTATSGNGLYIYGAASTFPTQSYNAENYWVDVMYSAAPATAPAITSTSPVGGATGVAITTAPTATFNQAVTSSSGSFTVKDSANNPVPGSLSFTSNAWIFKPTANLAYSTTYTATVSGVTNSSGQTLASTFSWSFTTAAAPAAPKVASTSPSDQSSGVAPSVVPSASFDQDVASSSILFTLKDPSNNLVAGSVSYSAGSKTANFTPTAPLAYSTSYVATVSGATNSTTGQTMTSAFSWSFSTAAAPVAPVVSSTNPLDQATGVGINTSPSVTFDQPVSANSVSFALKDGANNSVSGTLAYGGNVSTFKPASPLAYNTTYTAVVSGATNGSGQTMASPFKWSFTTAVQPAVSCPCSVFGPTTTPATANQPDGSSVELGMKFRSDVAGNVTGIRFYKGSQNTGTHTGKLWTSSGTLLASVTFSGETASGWQQANLSTPVAISPNTTYVVSYFAPNGHYAAEGAFFAAQAADNYPLHGLASGTDGLNGVYQYGSSIFPTNSFNATNYWVDVVLNGSSSSTTPTVSSTTPAAGASNVATTTSIRATYDRAISANSVIFSVKDAANATVPGTLSYDSLTNSSTFTPASALAYAAAYSVTVSGATTSAGQTMAAPYTWSFATAPSPGSCPCSVFDPTAVPTTVTVQDASAIELGMKFQSDVAGAITGVRFYKGAQNTGTHVGNLWTSGGQLLATVTFSGESATGWQQANFSTPVTISANTTYIVSYHTSIGYYSADGGFFAGRSAGSGHLQGLPDGTVGPNGVYLYGTGGFPSNSWNATNYWVDVAFTPSSP